MSGKAVWMNQMNQVNLFQGLGGCFEKKFFLGRVFAGKRFIQVHRYILGCFLAVFYQLFDSYYLFG